MNNKDVFRILQLIRLCFLAVLWTPLPLSVKLLILYVADEIDCNYFFCPISGKTFEYQFKDKIIDSTIYVVVLAYLFYKYPNPVNYILLIILLYRMIGIWKYKITHDNWTFVKYPDLFREFSIILAIVYDGWIVISWKNIFIIFALIGIIKIYIEYMLHIRGVSLKLFVMYFT